MPSTSLVTPLVPGVPRLHRVLFCRFLDQLRLQSRQDSTIDGKFYHGIKPQYIAIAPRACPSYAELHAIASMTGRALFSSSLNSSLGLVLP
jgi:hypothetical protein